MNEQEEPSYRGWGAGVALMIQGLEQQQAVRLLKSETASKREIKKIKWGKKKC